MQKLKFCFYYFLIVFFIGTCLLPIQQKAFGSDCKSATTATELQVCTHPALLDLDKKLNDEYLRLISLMEVSERNILRHQQGLWIKHRDDWCKAEAQCLTTVIGGRLQDIQLETTSFKRSKKLIDDVKKRKLLAERIVDFSAKGNLAKVKEAVDEGGDVNFPNATLRIALTEALEIDSQPIVEYLLESGAAVNKVGRSGERPFQQAARVGDLKIMKQLFKAGSYIIGDDLQSIAGIRAWDPYPEIEFCLASVPNLAVNFQGYHHSTAIQQRAQENDFRSVKLLLDHGADPALTNSDGKNALQMTTSPEIRKLFLVKGLKETPEEELAWCVELGNLERVKELVATGLSLPKFARDTQVGVMNIVAENGQTAMLDYLFNHGYSVDGINPDDPPLLYAANGKHGLYLAHSGSFESVKFLIDHGASLKCGSQGSLLEWGVQGGNLQVVKLLVEKGVTLCGKSEDEFFKTFSTWKLQSDDEKEALNQMMTYLHSQKLKS